LAAFSIDQSQREFPEMLGDIVGLEIAMAIKSRPKASAKHFGGSILEVGQPLRITCYSVVVMATLFDDSALAFRPPMVALAPEISNVRTSHSESQPISV